MKFNKENAMLIDVQYVRENRKTQEPDYLYIIWKDLISGEKHLSVQQEPTMDIYFEKPEKRNHKYNKTYERIENLYKRTVKYNSLVREIANEIGPEGKSYLNNIYATKDYGKMKDFMLYPYVFASDYDIRSFYRIKWLKQFDNNQRKPITKGFMDIEADSININGFADASTCPIDLVTLIDKTTMTSYTFALVEQEYQEKDLSLLNSKQKRRELERRELYNSRHIQEQQVMNDINGLRKELNERHEEHYGKIDYKFYFYKDERQLLIHLFQLINQLKLDFIEIWNISFDIPYILKRMEVLGLDPNEVICHPDFPVKECYFKKDKKNSLPKNKSDYFHCSSYTVFYDQMILYAAIRKSEKELRSNRLTDVAREELKDEKLDYSEEGNIKRLPYVNYRKYIIYNIKDVLLQLGIENRTGDLDTLYLTAYKNGTMYDQVFKQTLKLRNVQYLSFLDQGLIPGNNINIYNSYAKSNNVLSENEEDDDDSTFEGALVGNPILNDYFGMELYGQPSNSIFNYSIDMDMSSFYPNTIYTLNIDPTTLYFKTICDASQFEPMGGKLKYHGITDRQQIPTNDNSFEGDIAKEIFDNFQTRNWLSVGVKWNNLPNITEVCRECETLLSK